MKRRLKDPSKLRVVSVSGSLTAGVDSHITIGRSDALCYVGSIVEWLPTDVQCDACRERMQSLLNCAEVCRVTVLAWRYGLPVADAMRTIEIAANMADTGT